MSWLTDTIAGRTIVMLILGLGSILALAQLLYQSSVERQVTASNVSSVVERLLFMAESITALDAEKRDDAAHSMSGGPLELHWAREPLTTAGGNLDETATLLRDALIARSSRLAAGGLVIGSSRIQDDNHAVGKAMDEPHVTLLSLELSDGSWLNVSMTRVRVYRAPSLSVVLTALLGALGVVALAMLMSRWLTRPLEALASGAHGLFRAPHDTPLPETGTREVRTLASAINELQLRIRRLVDDRTQMLAAVSHDLRTPLTRLRLRIASIADGGVRKSIEADLDEMEQMIDATLALLRDDMADEPMEPVDLAAILETIASDASDAGADVSLQIPRSLVVAGRHLALKRALGNLVQNAVKHAGSAEVSASLEQAVVRIAVRDRGPGIPSDKHEAIFQPFYRLDSSRGRETGGHGLGLTVARSIVRAHGGEVSLRNLTPGLEVLVTLPVSIMAGAA